MTPEAITHLFNLAYDSFPPLEGKPSDDDLLAIQEALLPLLMVIPYDQLNGIHSLTASSRKPSGTRPNMATPNSYITHASLSMIKTLPTSPLQSSGFVHRRPIKPQLRSGRLWRRQISPRCRR